MVQSGPLRPVAQPLTPGTNPRKAAARAFVRPPLPDPATIRPGDGQLERLRQGRGQLAPPSCIWPTHSGIHGVASPGDLARFISGLPSSFGVSAMRLTSRGQGLAEYSLILALIAILAITALLFLSGTIQNILSSIGNAL